MGGWRVGGNLRGEGRPAGRLRKKGKKVDKSLALSGYAGGAGGTRTSDGVFRIPSLGEGGSGLLKMDEGRRQAGVSMPGDEVNKVVGQQRPR